MSHMPQSISCRMACVGPTHLAMGPMYVAHIWSDSSMTSAWSFVLHPGFRWWSFSKIVEKWCHLTDSFFFYLRNLQRLFDRLVWDLFDPHWLFHVSKCQACEFTQGIFLFVYNPGHLSYVERLNVWAFRLNRLQVYHWGVFFHECPWYLVCNQQWINVYLELGYSHCFCNRKAC